MRFILSILLFKSSMIIFISLFSFFRIIFSLDVASTSLDSSKSVSETAKPPPTKLIMKGNEIALFSAGAILSEVVSVAEELIGIGVIPRVYSFPTIKPIDKKVIAECARECKHIFTVEEHNIVGGFGSSVTEVVAELADAKAQVHRIGMKDEYTNVVGSQNYLRAKYGLDADSIFTKIKEVL